MNTCKILAENYDKLTKKLTTVRNRCRKFGCEFLFNKVGEKFEFVADENGEKHLAKFIIVEVEGEAKINGWTLVGMLEPRTAKENLVRQFDDKYEIPSRYFTSDMYCEHCNSSRLRKKVFLLYNEETCEWKQVGGSCLKDFTRGWSAENVASYISLFDTVIKGEYHLPGMKWSTYYPVSDIIRYAAEAYNKWGYRSKDQEYHQGGYSTAYLVEHLYKVDTKQGVAGPSSTDDVVKKAEGASFNPNSEYALSTAQKVEEYLSNYGPVENDSYMHNLLTIYRSGYAKPSEVGIVVSAIPTYFRYMRELKWKQEREEAARQSKHIGTVGDKVEFDAVSIKRLYTCEGIYGVSSLYEMKDKDGNVYTWWTSSALWDDVPGHVKGRIKGHSEYKGIKQTELTRCKVSQPDPDEEVPETVEFVESDKAIKEFYRTVESA